MSEDIRRAAEQGDPIAQFKLGWHIESASMRDIDRAEGPAGFLNFGDREKLQEAVTWYQRAAQQGHQMAVWRLAQAHEVLGSSDGVKHIALYRQLAQKGHSQAARVLGWCYEKGIHVEKDVVEAAKWYRCAADQGNASALERLGKMYLDGRGVQQSLGTARRLLKAAIRSSDAHEHYRESAHYARRWLEELESAALPAAVQKLERMIGIENVKSEIRQMIDFVEIQRKRRSAGLKSEGVSLHLVFTGNPGTGKTTVARYIGEIYGALGVLADGHLVEAHRDDLVAGYIGQTAIKAKEKIQEAVDGVLFIDEAYSLNAETGGRDFGSEAVSTLITEMENNRHRLAVIVAGYPEKMRNFIDMNPGLSSRFTRYIEFPDYKPEELFQMFNIFAENEDYQLAEDAASALREHLTLVHLMKGAEFGNGRYVRGMFEAAKEKHATRVKQAGIQNRDSLTLLTAADLPI
jgi:hypothetical protein